MKKVLITLLTLIFIVTMITTVYAATGSISIGASSDTVIKGKTFTVTVAGTAEDNITGMQGNLTYDTSKLSIESKAAGTGFFDASGSNEIAIGSSSSENLSKAGTLYTITFKVLEEAAEGETTISVTNAVLALVSGNTEATSDEVVITIKADDTLAGNQQGNTTQEPENTVDTPSNDNSATGDNNNSNSGKENENKNVNTNKNTNKTTNKNTNKTNKLPQTGAESASIIAIIALGAVSIASYVSYRKYKNI